MANASHPVRSGSPQAWAVAIRRLGLWFAALLAECAVPARLP
jgi:hypothetical protein